MFKTNSVFDLGAIKCSEQEAAAGAPAPDEAFLILVEHLIKQPKPFDIFGRQVAFADTTLQDGSFVQLPIVVPNRLYRVLPVYAGNCGRFDNPESMFPLSNGQGIVDVALRQFQQLRPASLSDVSFGFNRRDWEYCT